MKTNFLRAAITSAFLFAATAPVFAADKEDKPSAEDMALAKSFIVTGTVKQAIGNFSSFSRLQVGAIFELDLSNPPKEKMLFTLPPANPLQQPSNGGYIPFDAPIEIVKVKKSATGRVGIYLAANNSSGKFLIQIVADLPPKPDSWCSVLFCLEGSGDFISSSMAEASGAIKMKESAPADLPPKDAKEISPIRGPEFNAKDETPESIESAKLRGAETAAADIKAGVLRILYYGEPFPLKPLVDEATGYRVQIVAGCIVSKSFVAEADAYNQAMRDWHAKNPPPDLWPPPLDEKRIIGTWVRKNAPIQGVENHTLLILREDHSWNEAEISGPLTEPLRFKKFAPDSKWEVVNVGEKSTQTMLLFKHREGGSNVWNILKVGAEELEFSSFGPSIIDLRHYTRCDAQTAAKLNARLNQKETEPTAK